MKIETAVTIMGLVTSFVVGAFCGVALALTANMPKITDCTQNGPGHMVCYSYSVQKTTRR
jgi:hypothetical protein